MPPLSLPLAGDHLPEPPLYSGDVQRDLWTVSRQRLAEVITGGLSFPSKMDCPAWGIPKEHCRTGSKLAKKEGTTCACCYAAKGTFRFKAIQAKLRAAYEGLFHPLWVPSMIQQIRWHARERFRWFSSGDIQGISHLRNIIRICLETPDLRHWLPTREQETVLACQREIPENLTIRASATRVDGKPPAWWPLTSTVVTTASNSICPASTEGGSCGDHKCNACWDRAVQNVAYRRH